MEIKWCSNNCRGGDEDLINRPVNSAKPSLLLISLPFTLIVQPERNDERKQPGCHGDYGNTLGFAQLLGRPPLNMWTTIYAPH